MFQLYVTFITICKALASSNWRPNDKLTGGYGAQRNSHPVQRLVGRQTLLYSVLFYQSSIVFSEYSESARLALHGSVPHVTSIDWYEKVQTIVTLQD